MTRTRRTPSGNFTEEDPRQLDLPGIREIPAGGPRFGDHRGLYEFPLSDAWRAWMDASDAWLSQHDFAAFIEERITDVIEPDNAGNAWSMFEATQLLPATPAALLELSRGLSVNVEAKVADHQNLATGETRLMFETTHKSADGAPLKVPGGFVIAIPVFRSGDAYKMPVRLRLKVVHGNVTWKLKPYRTDLVFEDAFKGACDKVQAETALPLYVGSPEEDPEEEETAG